MQTPPAGLAVVLYGEDYGRLPRLESSRLSAELICATLAAIDGEAGVPKWLGASARGSGVGAFPIGGLETQLRPCLTEFRNYADQRGAEVIFTYIVGHGHTPRRIPHLLARDSDPRASHAGISVAEVLGILCGRRPKHVVACFDLCRVEQEPHAEGPDLHAVVIDVVERCSSLSLLFSTGAGEVAYGGRGAEPSPFAAALAESLSAREARLQSRSHFVRHLGDSLIGYARRTSATHSQPEFLFRPDTDSPLLVPQPGSLPFAEAPAPLVNGAELLRELRRAVAQRERRSFLDDPYLRDPSEVWPTQIEFGGSRRPALDVLSSNRNPAVMVGPSGSGKTILAKLLSLALSERGASDRLSFYVNSAQLPEFRGSGGGRLRDVAGDGDEAGETVFLETICEFIGPWRYGFPQRLPPATLGKLLRESRVTVLVDAVDELSDARVLKPFLAQCQRFGTPVVFCQPRDQSWIVDLLASPSVVVGRMLPISLDVLPLEGDEAQVLKQSFGGSRTPLWLQQLRHFWRTEGHLPTGPGEIARFSLEDVRRRLLAAAAKAPYHRLRERLPSAFAEATWGDLLLLALARFAVELRRRGFFVQCEEEGAVRALRDALTRPGFTPHDDDVSLALELAVHAGVLRRSDRPGAMVRFENRKMQDRLIAHLWRAEGIDAVRLGAAAASVLWETCVPEYGLITGWQRFPLVEVAASNPFVAAACIGENPAAEDAEVVLVAEMILEQASLWARSTAILSLAYLPNRVCTWMRERYTQSGPREKVTLALALGRFGGVDNTRFLKESYRKELGRRGGDAAYLRRRILDALMGSVTIPDVNEWFGGRAALAPNELLRVVRSAVVENEEELAQLEAVVRRLSRISVNSALRAYLLFHEFRLYAQRGSIRNEVLSEIEVRLRRALKAGGPRWPRCAATLLIEAAALDRLADPLFEAFLNEQDAFARGDMAFVLGAVGTVRHVRGLVEFYGSCSSERYPSLKSDVDLEGLLHDVALGIERALRRPEIRGAIGPADIDPLILPQRREQLLSLLAVVR